jgi:D-alanyl-D-alanine carboxypeptidase
MQPADDSASTQTVASQPVTSQAPTSQGVASQAVASAAPSAPAPTSPAINPKPGVLGVLPASAVAPPPAEAAEPPPPIKVAAVAAPKAETKPEAKTETKPESKPETLARAAPQHTGWIVQVGAFDVERDAQQRLSNAQAKIGHALDRADPFTEPVVKGDKTLYRARFAGFPQKDEADAVCKQLKRNDIDCMTIKN